jgi:hypothetical protein
MDGVTQQVAALAGMTPEQLRARYREVFGEDTRTGNPQWLRKRIAWRLQSLAEGDLSARARQLADELADADLRLNPPRDSVPVVAGSTRATTPARATLPPMVAQPSDDRLPPTGTVLTRDCKVAQPSDVRARTGVGSDPSRSGAQDQQVDGPGLLHRGAGALGRVRELQPRRRTGAGDAGPRVTQILNLVNLAPDSVEEILFLPKVETGRDLFQLRDLHLARSRGPAQCR